MYKHVKFRELNFDKLVREVVCVVKKLRTEQKGGSSNIKYVCKKSYSETK